MARFQCPKCLNNTLEYYNVDGLCSGLFCDYCDVEWASEECYDRNFDNWKYYCRSHHMKFDYDSGVRKPKK